MKNKKIEKQIRASLVEKKDAVWSRVEGELFPTQPVAEAELATNTGSVTVPNGNKKGLIAILLSALCLIIVLSCVLFPMLLNRKDLSGCLYIDINPSIQVVIDKNGKVSEVLALNNDALILLSRTERDEFTNLTPEDAAAKVWELAYSAGYISPLRTNNALLISGLFNDENLNNDINLKVKGALEDKIKAKGIYCAVLTEKQNISLKSEADRYGITISKYQLILDAKGHGVDIAEEEYSKISIASINEKISNVAKEKERNLSDAEKDNLREKHDDLVLDAGEVNANHKKPENFDDDFDGWVNNVYGDFYGDWNGMKDKWKDEVNKDNPPPPPTK